MRRCRRAIGWGDGGRQAGGLTERAADREPITPLHLFRNSIFSIASAQFLLAPWCCSSRCVSMGVLSLADQHTAAVAIVAAMTVAGAGIGFFVQVALLARQNAVEHRYLGVATGALNFFKSIGGALGAALFGAILAAAARPAGRADRSRLRSGLRRGVPVDGPRSWAWPWCSRS
jgi:hypothetical protein